MHIRLAEKADIPRISFLYNQFFRFNAGQQLQYYKQAIEPGTYPESVIDGKGEDLFLAVCDDTIVGFVHVVEEKTPPFDCFIQHKYTTVMDLFIEESFRKKGIGALLLDAARVWAVSRGSDYLELNVLSENENGIQFYRHENFAEVSHIMRCPLHP